MFSANSTFEAWHNRAPLKIMTSLLFQLEGLGIKLYSIQRDHVQFQYHIVCRHQNEAQGSLDQGVVVFFIICIVLFYFLFYFIQHPTAQPPVKGWIKDF